MQVAQNGVEPELRPIPNGLAGYESVVGRTYFPMKLCMAADSGPFESKVVSHQLGPILMTRLHATGHYSGQVRMEAGNPGENIVLNLAEMGGVFFEGRRSAATAPGDLILMSTAQAFDIWQQGTAQSLAIMVPAWVLTRKWGNLEALCLMPVASSEGAAAILRELMLSYWRQRASADPSAAHELMSAIVNLIGATFVRSSQKSLFSSLSMQVHFLRVRDLVMANLSNEELSADFISDALALSKSYLYSIMNSANTTLGRFILEERLERARQLLEFPTVRKRSISEIAFSVGFQELSHFSRRFSDRFGKSPKAYRAEICHIASELKNHNAAAP